MTSYNTGNPLGSQDPRDLYDNAENLDSFLNGEGSSYLDRLGRERKSYEGVVRDFEGPLQQAIQAAEDASTSASLAGDSEQAAATARDQSVAASEASGIARIFDTYTEAEAATDLNEGDIVEVVQDETRNAMVSRYRYESGALAYKWQPGQGSVTARGVTKSQAAWAEQVLQSAEDIDILDNRVSDRLGITTVFVSDYPSAGAMQGLADGQYVDMSDSVRGGSFVFKSGDMTSEVSADPLRGIYVPVGSPDGSTGALMRRYNAFDRISLSWFDHPEGAKDELFREAFNLALPGAVVSLENREWVVSDVVTPPTGVTVSDGTLRLSPEATSNNYPRLVRLTKDGSGLRNVELDGNVIERSANQPDLIEISALHILDARHTRCSNIRIRRIGNAESSLTKGGSFAVQIERSLSATKSVYDNVIDGVELDDSELRVAFAGRFLTDFTQSTHRQQGHYLYNNKMLNFNIIGTMLNAFEFAGPDTMNNYVGDVVLDQFASRDVFDCDHGAKGNTFKRCKVRAQHPNSQQSFVQIFQAGETTTADHPVNDTYNNTFIDCGLERFRPLPNQTVTICSDRCAKGTRHIRPYSRDTFINTGATLYAFGFSVLSGGAEFKGYNGYLVDDFLADGFNFDLVNGFASMPGSDLEVTPNGFMYRNVRFVNGSSTCEAGGAGVVTSTISARFESCLLSNCTIAMGNGILQWFNSNRSKVIGNTISSSKNDAIVQVGKSGTANIVSLNTVVAADGSTGNSIDVGSGSNGSGNVFINRAG